MCIVFVAALSECSTPHSLSKRNPYLPYARRIAEVLGCTGSSRPTEGGNYTLTWEAKVKIFRLVKESIRRKIASCFPAGFSFADVSTAVPLTSVSDDMLSLIVIENNTVYSVAKGPNFTQSKSHRRSREDTLMSIFRELERDDPFSASLYQQILTTENSLFRVAFAFYVGDGYLEADAGRYSIDHSFESPNSQEWVSHAKSFDDDESLLYQGPILTPTACRGSCQFAIPVFGGTPTHTYDIMSYAKYIATVKRKRGVVPWGARKSIAVFRGVPNSARTATSDHPRDKVIELTKKHPTLIDAYATRGSRGGKSLSLGEQENYKYQISVGKVKEWADRSARIMHSGSIMLLHENRPHCGEWWENYLLDKVNVVYFKDDVSNLPSVVNWLKTHDEEAQEILECQHRFAEALLQTSSHIDYLNILLYELGRVQY